MVEMNRRSDLLRYQPPGEQSKVEKGGVDPEGQGKISNISNNDSTCPLRVVVNGHCCL